MVIVWDEPKRLATLDKRGLDIADLTPEFFAAALIRPAKKDRLLAIGWLGEQSVAVVYRPLGSEGLSVVTMRPTNPEERRLL